MKSRLLITENEKNQIKSLYGLNEQVSGFQDLLNVFSGSLKGVLNPSSTDDKSKDGDKSEYDSSGLSTTTGKVDISKGNFDGEQQKNISHLIDEMNKIGITNPNTQIGILSVISKESGFKPKSEVSYANTSNSRIRSLFGSRVAKLSDSEIDELKSDPRKFFNLIYAKTVGNQGGEDGWNYRGRGFNQLTGRKNYEKYGSMTGENLVSDPDLLNKPEVASKVALAFFTKGKSPSTFPDFTDKIEAAKYFADINAGGHTSSHRGNAVAAAEKFSVKSDSVS
jgi:putative chitinase